MIPCGRRLLADEYTICQGCGHGRGIRGPVPYCVFRTNCINYKNERSASRLGPVATKWSAADSAISGRNPWPSDAKMKANFDS